MTLDKTPENLRPIVKRRRKVNGRRADFGIPVYWKPKLNGRQDKDGWIVVTQQKTWAGLCKRENRLYENKINNNRVVTDIIPEIDDLTEEEI